MGLGGGSRALGLVLAGMLVALVAATLVVIKNLVGYAEVHQM